VLLTLVLLPLAVVVASPLQPPSQPEPQFTLVGTLGSVDNPLAASDVVVEAPFLYVLRQNGFAIFSIATPQDPLLLGEYTTTDHVSAIAIRGRYAYLAASVDETQGFRAVLQIVDIANPAAIVRRARYRTPACLGGSRSGVAVAVVGGTAFLGTTRAEGLLGRSGDVRAFDVTNPREPRPVASFGEGLDWAPSALATIDSSLLAVSTCPWLYFSCASGLRLITRSPTSTLSETLIYTATSGIGGANGPRDLSIAGRTAALTVGESDLRLLTLSDALTATESAALHFDMPVVDVAYAGGVALTLLSSTTAIPAACGRSTREPARRPRRRATRSLHHSVLHQSGCIAMSSMRMAILPCCATGTPSICP
jgi:hypothetical protein